MATLATAITRVLKGVRLSTSVTEYKDEARTYLSTMSAELLSLVPGWFLDRETTFRTTLTFTITGASGTFTSGETITGGTSGKTATVDSYDSTNGYLYVYSESGDFTATETITGGTSGATATFSSSAVTRVYTPISGPVTNWTSFHNETQNWPVPIIESEAYDDSDPDRDWSANAEAIQIGGLQASTGYPTLDVWPAAAPSGDVIRVKYRMDIAAWTSSDDSSTMQVLGIPRSLESALIYGARKLYLDDNRQYEPASEQERNMNRALAGHSEQAKKMNGNRRYPAKRYGAGDGDDGVTIIVGSDTVTAA